MAIDTIMLSFCEDCESHNGTPQYAPVLLLQAIGKVQLVKQRKRDAKQIKVEAKKGKELSRNKELYALNADSRAVSSNPKQ